jgi:tetratricopeptide (TPR) repeat protein
MGAADNSRPKVVESVDRRGRQGPRGRIPMTSIRPLALLFLANMAANAGFAGEIGSSDPAPSRPSEALNALILTGTGVDDLSRSYRSLYLAFADADRAAAIAQAAAFERATVAAEPKKGFERLLTADSELFGRIAEADPRSLLALCIFYQDLAYRHAADRSWGLLLRADRATEELLRRLARVASSDEDKALASAAYQAFAADLLEIYAPDRAAEMLDQALALTPADVNANLTVAILMQRDERYPQAALRLDRALETDPQHREARLRRALIRARVDPEGKALKELESLSAGRDNDWITVVATQERGRLLLAADKLERAIAWFSAAAERFPTEHSFRTALAFAQARAGRRNAAAISARALLAAPRDHTESARRRFADSPVRLIDARRVEMRAAAETRWDELKVALASFADPAAAPAEGVR